MPKYSECEGKPEEDLTITSRREQSHHHPDQESARNSANTPGITGRRRTEELAGIGISASAEKGRQPGSVEMTSSWSLTSEGEFWRIL